MLDDAGATLRIVDDRQEFTLHREEVGLARERTESATLHESDGEFRGTIYVLPIGRRFELHPTGGGEALKGVITPDCLARLTGGGTEVAPGVIGTEQSVRLRIRRSEEHTSELQSLMRISYAVF